jgi:hypothetical protein
MIAEEIVWTTTTIALILLSILMLMYLSGRFSYKDEIYSSKKYKLTGSNYHFGTTTEQYVERIIIKRIYLSGRIKFITKEVRA